MPNILPKISFLTFGFCTFFRTFNPQKVKKTVTFCPVATAPFANTKVAKALSKSSLKRIKVFPLPAIAPADDGQTAAGSPFSIVTV